MALLTSLAARLAACTTDVSRAPKKISKAVPLAAPNSFLSTRTLLLEEGGAKVRPWNLVAASNLLEEGEDSS